LRALSFQTNECNIFLSVQNDGIYAKKRHRGGEFESCGNDVPFVSKDLGSFSHFSFILEKQKSLDPASVRDHADRRRCVIARMSNHIHSSTTITYHRHLLYTRNNTKKHESRSFLLHSLASSSADAGSASSFLDGNIDREEWIISSPRRSTSCRRHIPSQSVSKEPRIRSHWCQFEQSLAAAATRQRRLYKQYTHRHGTGTLATGPRPRPVPAGPLERNYAGLRHHNHERHGAPAGARR